MGNLLKDILTEKDYNSVANENYTKRHTTSNPLDSLKNAGIINDTYKTQKYSPSILAQPSNPLPQNTAGPQKINLATPATQLNNAIKNMAVEQSLLKERQQTAIDAFPTAKRLTENAPNITAINATKNSILQNLITQGFQNMPQIKYEQNKNAMKATVNNPNASEMQKAAAQKALYEMNTAENKNNDISYLLQSTIPNTSQKVNNSLNTVGSALAQIGIGGISEELNSARRALTGTLGYTEVENNTLNYLRNNDPASYERYKDILERERNRQATEVWNSNQDRFTQEHPNLSKPINAINSVSQHVLGVTGAKEGINQVLKNAISGRNDLIDINKGGLGYFQQIDNATENLTKDMGPVGKMITEAALGAAQNLITLPLGPVGSLAVNSLAAGAKKLIDDTERGISPQKAVLDQVVATATEAVTEKIGLDNIFKTLNRTPSKSIIKNVLTGVVDVLKQAGIEGLEEELSELINQAWDLTNGDKSQFSVDKKGYMENGDDEDSANAKAFFNVCNSVIESAIVGAISGGMLGGASSAIGGVTNRGLAVDENSNIENKDNLENVNNNEFNNTEDKASANSKDINIDEDIELDDNLTLSEMIQGRKNSDLGKAITEKTNQDLKTNQSYKIISDRLYDNGRKAYLTNLEKADNKVIFTKAFKNMYESGLANFSLDESMEKNKASLSLLNDETRERIATVAYYAGQNDKTEMRASQEANIKVLTNSRKLSGKVTLDTNTKVNENITRGLRELAKVAKIDIVITDGSKLDENVNGLYKDGTIYLSSDSDKPYAVVALHEVTHSLKENSLEAYREYEDFVIKKAMENDEEGYLEKYNAIIKASENNDLQLTEDEIREEIAADLSEKFLQDEESIKKFVAEKPSIAKRVLDVIKNLARKFRNMFTKADKNYSYEDTKLLGDYFYEAQAKWIKALSETKKGEETEVKAKYSLRTDSDGKKIVVLDRNIFEGVERKNRKSFLLKYMLENFSGKEFITYDQNGNEEKVYVPTADVKLPNRSRAINKYVYTGRNDFNNNIRQDALSQIDEIIEASQYRDFEDDKNNKHGSFAEGGWEYRTVTIEQKSGDDYKRYEAVVNIAKGAEKNYIYDVNNIKYIKTIHSRLKNRQQKNSRQSISSKKEQSTRENPRTNSPSAINNSISTKDNNVKNSLKLSAVDRLTTNVETLVKNLNKEEMPYEKYSKLKSFIKRNGFEEAFNNTYKEYNLEEKVKKIADNADLNIENKEEFKKKAKEILDYKNPINIINFKDKNTAYTHQAFYDLIKEYAREKVETENVYEEVKQALKGKKIYVDEATKNDLGKDNWTDLLKHNIGLFTTDKSKGIAVDSLWVELSEQYPNFFREETTAQSDQIKAISDLMQMERESRKTSYAKNGNFSETFSNHLLDITSNAVLEEPIIYYENQIKSALEDFDLKIAQKYIEQSRNEVNKVLSERVAKLEEQLKKAEKTTAENIYRKGISSTMTSLVGDLTVFKSKDIIDKDLMADVKSILSLIKDGSFYGKKTTQRLAEFEKGTSFAYKKTAEINAKILKTLNDNSINDSDKVNLYIINRELKKLSQLIRNNAIYEKGEQKLERYKDDSKETKEKLMYRNSIKRGIKSLTTSILKPTKQKHISANLYNGVAEFLGLFKDIGINDDMKTIKINNIINNLKNLQAEGNGIIDPMLESNIESLKDIVGNEAKPLSKYNSKELSVINNAVMSVLNVVNNENKLFANEKKQTLSQVASRVEARLARRKDQENKTNYAKDFFENTIATPETVFERAGMQEEFEALVTAECEKQKRDSSIIKAVKDTFNVLGETRKEQINKVKELMGFSKKNLVDFKGHKVSKGQLLSLIVAFDREQAKGHILNGGVAFKALKALKQSRNSDVVNITDEDITELKKKFSESEISFAYKLRDCLDMATEWLNNTFEELFGYRPFTEKNYFPMESDSRYVEKNNIDVENANVWNGRKLENIGFTKNTVEGANNPLVIDNILTTVLKHLSEANAYASYVKPLSDIERITKFQDKSIGFSMKSELERKIGKGGIQYINKFLADMNMNAKREVESTISQKLIGKAKRGMIAANIRVFIQQPTAYFRAFAVLDPKNIKYDPTYLAKAWETYQEKVKSWGLVMLKDRGYSEMGTTRSLNEELLGSDSIIDSAVEMSMKPSAIADGWTWGLLILNCADQVKAQNPNLDPKSEEFDRLHQKLFNEVIEKTQVCDSPIFRSAGNRSSNGFNAMEFSFMAEPLKSVNLLMQQTDKLLNVEMTAAEKKQVSKKLLKSTIAVATSHIVNSIVVAAFVDAWRDKDEENNYFERVFKKFLGLSDDFKNKSVFENTLDAGYKAIGDIFGYIPYLNDVISIIDGYEVERLDMSAITKLIKSGIRLKDWTKQTANGTEPKNSGFYVVKDFVENIGQAYGIPLANLDKDIQAVIRASLAGLEKVGLDISYADFIRKTYFLNIKNSKNWNTYIDDYYNELEKGNLQTANKIKREMIANGIPKERIKDRGETLKNKKKIK